MFCTAAPGLCLLSITRNDSRVVAGFGRSCDQDSRETGWRTRTKASTRKTGRSFSSFLAPLRAVTAKNFLNVFAVVINGIIQSCLTGTIQGLRIPPGSSAPSAARCLPRSTACAERAYRRHSRLCLQQCTEPCHRWRRAGPTLETTAAGYRKPDVRRLFGHFQILPHRCQKIVVCLSPFRRSRTTSLHMT